MDPSTYIKDDWYLQKSLEKYVRYWSCLLVLASKHGALVDWFLYNSQWDSSAAIRESCWWLRHAVWSSRHTLAEIWPSGKGHIFVERAQEVQLQSRRPRRQMCGRPGSPSLIQVNSQFLEGNQIIQQLSAPGNWAFSSLVGLLEPSA